MAKALYRKYRSRSLAEVVGQDHITKTLTKALKTGRLRHAYLLSGPRGVGKTSVARILAHEVNKLPYKDDEIHLDIIEIDAASNRRIDEVRDLRDKVHITPTSAQFKVYIIDEVHMLTREAFNALLKTLEEPPEHVIFILATTEAHKLPPTIISRTQHFTFRPVDIKTAADHLATIAKREKIKISPSALELLAEYGDGSFRDSISLLDQLSASGSNINDDDVRQLVGLPPDKLIDELLKAVERGDSQVLITNLDGLDQSGVNPLIAAKLIGKKLRQRVLESTDAASIKLLRELVDIPASHDPRQSLELALLAAAAANSSNQSKVSEPEIEQAVPETEVVKPRPTRPPAKTKKSGQPFELDQWPVVLKAVKDKAPSLYSALRLAKPEVSDDSLILNFEFLLHKKKVDNAQAKTTIAEVIEELSGASLSIETAVSKAEKSASADNQAPVESISNIFGGAEVLES